MSELEVARIVTHLVAEEDLVLVIRGAASVVQELSKLQAFMVQGEVSKIDRDHNIVVAVGELEPR